MIRYPMIEKKQERIAFGLFLLAMLLLSRNTLVTSSILGLGKSQALMMALLLGAGLVFLIKNRRSLKKILLDRRIPAAFVFSLILLIPMVVKRDWQMTYFTILLGIWIAVFFSYFLSLEDGAKYYVVILTVLGVYSVLATYLLRILPDRGILNVPVFYNSRDVMFHNFGLAYVSDEYVKNRNFGIFREPGVYQYFIILALYLNNYVVTWEKDSRMWIVNVLLSVTMLSTFATGGVAELGLLVLVVFFEKKLYRDRRILWLAIALVAAMVAALILIVIQKGPIYWELYGMLIYKFTPEAESSSERMQAILVDLEFFLRNPLVGARVAEVLHAVANNTTSTMVMLAVSGIAGGLLHVAGWVALAWRSERKLWANLASLLILFVSFNTQNLTVDVFFWMFPIMAVVQRWLPAMKRKE